MLPDIGCNPDLHLYVECNGVPRVEKAVSREDNPKTFILNLCWYPIPSHWINALISASLLHVYSGSVWMCVWGGLGGWGQWIKFLSRYCFSCSFGNKFTPLVWYRGQCTFFFFCHFAPCSCSKSHNFVPISFAVFAFSPPQRYS